MIFFFSFSTVLPSHGLLPEIFSFQDVLLGSEMWLDGVDTFKSMDTINIKGQWVKKKKTPGRWERWQWDGEQRREGKPIQILRIVNPYWQVTSQGHEYQPPLVWQFFNDSPFTHSSHCSWPPAFTPLLLVRTLSITHNLGEIFLLLLEPLEPRK